MANAGDDDDLMLHDDKLFMMLLVMVAMVTPTGMTDFRVFHGSHFLFFFVDGSDQLPSVGLALSH